MERLTIDEVIEHCRRTCEKIELFAIARGQEQGDITSKNYWEHYQVEEWLKELKQYRDAEEQGLLIKLPCKIGDTVYIIHNRVEIIEEQVFKIIQRINEPLKFRISIWEFEESEFGKTVFLTHEDAERALQALKGGVDA